DRLAIAGVVPFIVALQMDRVNTLLLEKILKNLSKFSGTTQQRVNDWLLTINQVFDACELPEQQRRKWAIGFLSDEALKWYNRQLIKFET
ncbi:unnamed protein product, partial [Didymodactylos carnosus]